MTPDRDVYDYLENVLREDTHTPRHYVFYTFMTADAYECPFCHRRVQAKQNHSCSNIPDMMPKHVRDEKIYELHKQGVRAVDLAVQFGSSTSMINDVIRKREIRDGIEKRKEYNRRKDNQKQAKASKKTEPESNPPEQGA